MLGPIIHSNCEGTQPCFEDDWSILHEINLPSSCFRPFHQHYPAENTSNHVTHFVLLPHVWNLRHVPCITLWQHQFWTLTLWWYLVTAPALITDIVVILGDNNSPQHWYRGSVITHHKVHEPDTWKADTAKITSTPVTYNSMIYIHTCLFRSSLCQSFSTSTMHATIPAYLILYLMALIYFS